ncbi:MAG TPA: glycolate oxidase subunit GlcF [Steroidobacteraceae bacterium]|nr:glycolate oxidase subunit GlcF [Steroidobacteraceae bacterium]
MQTHFSPAQLAHPQVAESDRILRKCVHCGFCTATCPTYLLTGDELDGPRGRIYLAKDMLEKDRPADATTVKHLDRCLTCLSCMTTCPSGVHYMHLIDHARQHIERTYRRPFGERALRALLALVLPYTGRFRWALRAAAVARPFRALLPARLRGLIDTARAERSAQSETVHGLPQNATARRRRVALLPGCVQPALRPQINEATVRLLNRYGVEVVVAKGTGCCGALVHHLGREHQSLAQAKADIDAWTREIEAGGLDAIIVTASGCGTMLKDYGFLFRNDPAYAEKAARVASLARDVTEVLAEVAFGPEAEANGTAARGASEPAPNALRAPESLRVAYHSACSLQHGQRLHSLPADLLRKAGFTVLDIPESHICCGSAGTYSLLQPEMSTQLRERKARNIESVEPAVIATGNIGCITQIAQATAIPIVHTVELLDWAAGGPKPAGLR